jgi:hypothetical protein
MRMKIASDLPEDLEELIRTVIGATIEVHRLISYLKSTKLRAGLLINFNVQQLKSGIHRVVV